MAITEAAKIGTESLGINLERLEVLDSFFINLISEGKQDFIAARVLRRGVKIFSGDYGVSSPGGPPLTADAIFPVASITKPIVATMIAILQEDGLVDFIDPVQRYFPGFIGENKDRVELWHLLCHSSGMDEMATDKYIDSYIKDELGMEIPPDGDPGMDEFYLDAAMLARQKLGLPDAERSRATVDETYYLLQQRSPLATVPGETFSYNSMGYDMISKIVATITGESIDEFARRKIFDPLGMTDTHWILPESKWSRVVKRDPSYPGGGWLNGTSVLTSTSGGGGLKTTMDDIAWFGQMFLQNGTLSGKRILSPASVRMLTADYNSHMPMSQWGSRMLSSSWGFGWSIKNGKKDDLGMLRSDSTYDHGGYGGARLVVDPENELVISMYTVDHEETNPYPFHSRTANIILSALD